MKYDDFGERMKQYEKLADFKLKTKVPVAIRLDGRAFHTWTKGLNKPFDAIFYTAMQATMKSLCEEIQGCVFGYHQSDEITLILIDYQNENSSPWFDYRIQKITSVAASMATKYFNQYFEERAMEYYQNEMIKDLEDEDENDEEPIMYYSPAEDEPTNEDLIEELNEYGKVKELSPYISTLLDKCDNGATFDARCFNIEKDEVCNLIYWRQVDAIRNSIQAMGQSLFSHKELQNKTQKDIKEMLLNIHNIDYDSFIPIFLQRGSACYKEEYLESVLQTPENLPHFIVRSRWKVDLEMPLLKGEDRQYIEKLINF